jgi:multiple sugar transport system permease protein
MEFEFKNKAASVLKLASHWRVKNAAARTSRFLWAIVHYVVIFGICFIILQPLIQKIANGFMSPDDILDPSVIYIPKNFETTFYSLSFEALKYWPTLRDTVVLCLLVGVLEVFSASLVAYGFARFKFPGRTVWFGLLLLAMIVPQIVILIPQYITMRTFDFFGLISLFKPGGVNLLGTFWPYILTSLTIMGFKQGLFVYLLRQYYRGIPKEFEESAYIDGCTKMGTYFRIIIPGAVVMLLACFLFATVWTWTDSFYVTYYMPPITPFGKRLISVTVEVVYLVIYKMGYVGAVGTPDYISQMPPVGYMVAAGNVAVLLAIAPLILVYTFMQRFFIESIERSGLK